MSDEVQTCAHATEGTRGEGEGEEEDMIDIYDPGDGNPYTHEYIFKHEPFCYIPNAYYPEPDEEFTPPCLVVGVGLLREEAIPFAEEHGFLVPSASGSKYSATARVFAYRDIANHFSKLFDCRMEAVTVLSRKCHFVLALFDSYSRPDDKESARKLKHVMKKLVKIFPAARERCGWFYWAMNESMYPPGYSRLMYKHQSTRPIISMS